MSYRVNSSDLKLLTRELAATAGSSTGSGSGFSDILIIPAPPTTTTPYEDMRSANGNQLAQVAMLQLVTSGAFQPSFLPSCPVLIVELAQRCLALRPADRPSAPELAYALRQIMQSMAAAV